MHYITQNWSFDPFLIVVAVLVVAHEIGLARLRRRSDPVRTRRRRLHSLAFYGGLGVLLIAIDSPIDYWADDYFFVHMIEHLLIAFYAPILIVLGAPWIPLLFALPVRARRKVGRFVMLGSWSRVLQAGGEGGGQPLVRPHLLQRGHGRLALPRALRPGRKQPDRPHLADARELLRHRRAVLAPDHPLTPLPAQGQPHLAGRGGHQHQHRHVRPGHGAEHLQRHQLVHGLCPRAGRDAVRRSPTSRSVPPSSGCAATSGRCRR